MSDLKFKFLVAPVTEWLRPLVYSALNRLIISATACSSLARGTCETNQVLLAGCQIIPLGDLTND